MAVITDAWRDLVLGHHLVIHAGQEFLLVIEELLNCRRLEATLRALLVSDRFEFVADTLLENLQTVLGILEVELGQVRNWSNCNQYSVVLDFCRLGSERCDHGNPLSGAKWTQRLVFDVSPLKNDGAALGSSHIFSWQCNQSLLTI